MLLRACRRQAAFLVALSLLTPVGALARDDQSPARPQPGATATNGPRIGIDAFGGAGVTLGGPTKSLEAVGLDSYAVEFGGGARVTNIWRELFLQVAASRWSATGERSFIDSTGARFPLGIPLDLKATYVDASLGWKTPAGTLGGHTIWSYFGGGAGVAQYTEASPFAQPGDDLDTRSTSYHVLAGVEVPLSRWLALAFDGRYRHVPGILGGDGVSGEVGDKVLGGLQTSVALRLGFGGRARPQTPRRPSPEPQREPARQPVPGALIERADAPSRQLRSATVMAQAPVYLLPDINRTPLRTLTPGTPLRVLAEAGEWVRVEFHDPQFGTRVGYVERKFVEVR